MVDAVQILSSTQLPSLPMVAVRLLELSRDPESTLKDIAATVQSDPALAAKILKVTNSSFFGLQSKVTSIDRAVPLLGKSMVTSLTLSFSLEQETMTGGPIAEHYESYWLQSTVQALAAETVSQEVSGLKQGDVFLAGLLSDLGRLVMLKAIPEEYSPVLVTARDSKRSLAEVERDLLGIDHVSIGVQLLRTWNMPEPLISAVKHHHDLPADLRSLEDSPALGVIRAAAIGSLVGEFFCSQHPHSARERIVVLTSEFYGFTAAKVDELLARIRSRLEELGSILSINSDRLPHPADLIFQANEQLVQMALNEHVNVTEAEVRRQEAVQENKQLHQPQGRLGNQTVPVRHSDLNDLKNFKSFLSNEIRKCRRTADQVGIIHIVIDRFKALRDAYGHSCGDRVLWEIVGIVKRGLRTSDLFAQCRSEEFVVLVGHPTEKGIVKLAERLRSSVESAEILHQGKPIPTTISLGVAVALPRRHEEHLEQKLLDSANNAACRAEKKGGNCVQLQTLIDDDERDLSRRVLQRRFSRWLVEHKEFDITVLSQALLKYSSAEDKIGELSQRHGWMTAEQVAATLEEQRYVIERFGSIAVRQGRLTRKQLIALLALQREDPQQLGRILLAQGAITEQRLQQLTDEYSDEFLPVSAERKTLIAAGP